MKLRITDWRLNPTSGGALEPLDGLRGIAILMVVFFHAIYVNPGAAWPVRAAGDLAGAGWMGVPLFFVLSGFLISLGFFQNRRQPDPACVPTGYFRRRFFKIVPPFYVSLIVFAAIHYGVTRHPDTVKAAGMYALGLNSFLTPPVELNRVYWSLIVEVQFYLILPLLFLATAKFSGPRAAGGIVLLLLAGPLLWRWGMMSNVSVATFKVRNGMMVNQIDFFGWGIAFAYFYSLRHSTYRHLARLHWLSYWGAALFLGAMCWWAWLNHSFDYTQRPALWLINVLHLWLGAACFFLLFTVFLPGNVMRRLLQFPVLMLFGIVSYEWFLFHDPVLRWLTVLVGPSRGNLLLVLLRTVVPVISTLVFAAAFYRWFSLPLLRAGRETRNEKTTHRPDDAKQDVPETRR